MTPAPRASGIIDGIAGTAAEPAADLAAPAGLAFSVPELMMLTGWAEFHELRLVIELDHCVDGDEYEEVAVLYQPGSRLRRWMLWRAPDAVVVEPMKGPAFRVGCIADLLQHLLPAG